MSLLPQRGAFVIVEETFVAKRPSSLGTLRSLARALPLKNEG